MPTASKRNKCLAFCWDEFIVRSNMARAFDARHQYVYLRSGALLALVVAGCSATKTTTWPGASTPENGRDQALTVPTPSANARAPRVLDPALLASLVTATDKPYLSQGHEPPNTLVQVWVNADFVAAYRAWNEGSKLPPGTWLVARHSRSGGELSPVFYAHGEESGVRFGVADAEGYALPFAREVCQDCHTQARAESVFGVPDGPGPKP